MSHQPQTRNPGKARTQGEPPLRKCIVSGAVRPKTEMFRFVIGPDGRVVPDLNERLPGRGLWLSAERDMVNTACTKGLFAKVARREVKVPPGLEEVLEGLMVRRCLDLIGLARRVGDVVQGFEKAQARFRSGKGGVLLQARDGAAGGRKKIRALAPAEPLLDLFSARELGQALGRDRAVHVVMAKGRLAESLIREAGRLRSFGRQMSSGRQDEDRGA